jgi:uncharacterized protein
MTTSYPGVYLKEVSSGVRPIQAAGTSTAAFLGRSERGPIGDAVAISNFTEFQQTFGGFLEEHYLSHAVFQFFNNGGSRCYVVRVVREGGQNAAANASATLGDRHETPKSSVLIRATSAGEWGNSLEVDIVDDAADSNNAFAIVVAQPIPGKTELRQLERFDGLSMNAASRDFVEKRVNVRSKYVTVTVQAASENGTAAFVEGSDLAVVPQLDGAHRKLLVNFDGDGVQELDLSGKDVSDLDKVADELEKAIQGLRPLRSGAPGDMYSKAAVTVTAQDPKRIRITSGTAGAGSSVEIRPAGIAVDAAGLLGLSPASRSVSGSAVLRPAKGHYLIGDGVPVPGGPLVAVEAGSDGDRPDSIDYVNALKRLDTVRDISLIAIPGIGEEAVVAEGMNYCERRPLSDCFYIADMDVTDVNAKAAKKWQDTLPLANSYGAVYFPWLLMLDPNGGPEPIPVPPSGFVAGVYARTDAQRGVWKTPAGTQAAVAGAVGLTADISDVEHGELNTAAKSVSVIRRFPASGLVIWGGRTISSDQEWRYISPRRMAIFLRVSIFNGIQWAVFEPNDEPLWSQLRLNLTSFMMTLFRKGAFQGATPNEAFFVKVDKETTTQDDIDNGVVNILVGFAPVKPAEFVVVQLSQKAGQS